MNRSRLSFNDNSLWSLKVDESPLVPLALMGPLVEPLAVAVDVTGAAAERKGGVGNVPSLML